MAVVVIGGISKDTIVAAAINCRHSQQCRLQYCWLNPTATAIDNDHYLRRQGLPSPLPHSQQ
jgi:hypothetical protein